VIPEQLDDGHHWSRICDQQWADPLDPKFAQITGGRWNPPDSWPTLYLSEDAVTARENLRAFIAGWPYEPEDLRGDTGPGLAVVTLPRHQLVADARTPEGVAALGLPATYPRDRNGDTVDHDVCQDIGREVHDAGLRGVQCRSAQSQDGAGREVAWYPATARSRARLVELLAFDDWYWR
jgi:hypothetical protein